MHPPWKIELRALLKLSLPVVTVQVGMMLMGFVDAMMVGHDETHLAAAALGNFYSLISTMFGIGILLSLDPVMSQAVGAGDEASITRNLHRGVDLCVALTLPISAVFMCCWPILSATGQEEKLVALATSYVWTLIPSILPFYLFQIFRTTLQAYHRTAPVVWTIVICNVANVFLNWVFIFGHLGLAPMGVEGSAVATTISRWLMFALLLVVGRAQIWHRISGWSPDGFRLRPLIRLCKVGAPIGIQMALEFGAFGATLLMMGWISVSALAGHQAAINLASMAYMFGLGVSAATSVRVGNGVGRGDVNGARWSALMGLIVGVVVMGVFAAAFVLFPGPLASLFSDQGVDGAWEVCVVLLPIAAVFQVMDGIQVVSLGALRGVADTKVPMLINLFGFWCLGIPVGYVLAFPNDMGPEGLWWGLTVGLGSVAICLTLRVWVKLRGDVQRLSVEETTGVDPL